jgi:branched-chain amino acid transport system substrate-binding protein
MSLMRKFAYAAAVATALGAPATQAAEVSGNAVKIALLTDMSGVYAGYAGRGSEIAARMAIEDAGGKVAGAPVTLLVADHQNKADIAAAKAREMADQEGVDAFLEMIGSAVALAVNDVAKDKERVTMYVGAGTTRLTNEGCHPGTVHWVYDTYALATGTADAVVDEGYKKWYFISADYAFGQALESDVTRVVKAKGGEVVGGVRHPLGTQDFSSFLLQAQNTNADVIALANAGPDFLNGVRAAKDFGVTKDGGKKLAGMIVTLSDTHALGLNNAQGLLLTTGFYWDQDEQTREWAKRFEQRAGFKPNEFHAGTYSALSNYLKAIDKAGTDDRDAVMKVMRETPVNDFFARNGKLRADGRLVYDMYLAQVKTPKESKGEWDYYKILRTIPGDQAYMPLSQSKCPLVKQ